MYNRYVPGRNGHVRIQEEETKTHARHRPSSPEQKYTPPSSGAQEKGREREEKFFQPSRQIPGKKDADHSGDKSGSLKKILNVLKLESVDSGDLLLFLILLLLLTDGDDLDLLIALGLIVVIGMGEKKNPDSGGLSGLLGVL